MLTWERGSRSHADSVNVNPAEARLSRRQAFDLFRDTIWPPWQSRAASGGAAARQPTSPRRFSPLFLVFSETGTGEDGAAIKHAASSGIIQQSDTFIVSRLIYGFQPQTEFTFL